MCYVFFVTFYNTPVRLLSIVPIQQMGVWGRGLILTTVFGPIHCWINSCNHSDYGKQRSSAWLIWKGWMHVPFRFDSLYYWRLQLSPVCCIGYWLKQWWGHPVLYRFHILSMRLKMYMVWWCRSEHAGNGRKRKTFLQQGSPVLEPIWAFEFTCNVYNGRKKLKA